MACMLTILCACSASDTPDIFAPDVPGVIVFSDGKMDYTVVTALHASGLAYPRHRLL